MGGLFRVRFKQLECFSCKIFRSVLLVTYSDSFGKLSTLREVCLQSISIFRKKEKLLIERGGFHHHILRARWKI